MSDRNTLIRLAATLPVGSAERRAIITAAASHRTASVSQDIETNLELMLSDYHANWSHEERREAVLGDMHALITAFESLRRQLKAAPSEEAFRRLTDPVVHVLETFKR